jgi:hypothetical protein
MSLLVAALLAHGSAVNAEATHTFDARDFGILGDGKTDETAALMQCFKAVAQAGGGTVTIPPGDYYLPGKEPIVLSSRTTVFAYGARFHLPKDLGDKARIVLFSGTDIEDLSWFGGDFRGHCFDYRRDSNTWEPNANTKIIEIKTTAGGKTERLTFRDIQSRRVAGVVIGVSGVPKAGSASEVDTFARYVTIENCTLLESGKFMWDYGLLWQILVWPEDYSPKDVAMAQKYFRNDLIVSGLKLTEGDDRVWLDNGNSKLVISETDRPDHGVCFFGDALPQNITRGRIYYIVEATPEFVKISKEKGGEALRFQGTAGPHVKLIRNLRQAFLGLYQPTGAGPGKGGLDLVCCQHVTVRGCRLSALSDTMHIQKCHGVVFSGNHIIGSRMGAFFLAEYCKNATITGNTVDGGNGSRVMSVERSCEDVTIIGNTFRNGGRGSWINQPKNLILQGNIFINNTTKGENDPWRGRRSWKTGGWQSYPELYFTTYEPIGRYGPVIVHDNIFQTGPEAAAAVHFEAGGSNILLDGNIFRGSTGKVLIDEAANVTFGTNNNAQVERPAEGLRFGNP